MNIVRSGKTFVTKPDIDIMLLESVGFARMPRSRCVNYVNAKAYNDVDFCLNRCSCPCLHFMSGQILDDNFDWYEDDGLFYARLKKYILLNKHVAKNYTGKRTNYARWASISVDGPTKGGQNPSLIKRWRRYRRRSFGRNRSKKEFKRNRIKMIYEEYELLINPKPARTRYARYILWKREYARKYRNLLR